MHSFKALVSIFLVFSLFLLTSCGDSFSAKDTELVIGVENIDGELNPLYSVSESDKIISSQIFGYVQIQGTDNSLVNSCGGISYEYVGDSQVKYTVTLRDDMFFSDGRNVTIDDLIFFYHFAADATYDGVYSDWYLNDIVGLKEYYYDDADYVRSLAQIDSEVTEKYSSSTISKSDYINYLIATKLEGKFAAGLNSLSPNGKTWADYFRSIEYIDELEKLGTAPSETELLSVAARAEVENNPQSYNPQGFYKEKLIREYIGSNYSDGDDVSSISGIRKINDYSCTVLFNSRNLNAVSEINAPIISKADYETDYVKGSAASIKQKISSAVGSGPYKLEKTEDGTVILSSNEFYHGGKPDFSVLKFSDLALQKTDPVDAINKGIVDIISVDASDEVISQISTDNIKTVISNKKSYISVFFNTASLDLPVRKALSGLCNLNLFLSSEIGRYYTAVYMPLSIRFPEYPTDVISPVYSEKIFDAYRTMYPDGIKAVDAYYSGSENDIGYRILTEYKNILSENGISMNTVICSENELMSAIASGKADLWVESVADTPTCDKFEYYNSVGSMNKTGLNNGDINVLTASVRSAIGFSDRNELTRRLLNSVMEQAVECPVCQLQTVTAYNTEKISPDSVGENFDYDGFVYVLSELKMN